MSEEKTIPIKPSPTEELSYYFEEIVESKWFRVALILIFGLMIGLGISVTPIDTSTPWSVIISIFKAFYYGFDVLAKSLFTDPNVSFIMAWVFRIIYSTLFFWSFLRPVLTIEFWLKFAIILLIIAMIVGAVYTFYTMYSKVTP